MVSSQSQARHPDRYNPSDNHPKEFHVSPGLAAVEPAVDMRPHHVGFQRDRISHDRPSVGREVFRAIFFGLIIIAIAGGALAWQSSDVTTKDTVRAWGISLSGLSSVFGSGSPPATAGRTSNTSDQASTQDAAPPQAARIPQSSPASAAAASSADPQHQLETVASDLAAMRRIVEQVAAKQEQMGQDIAALQAAERNVSQKLSSLSQAATAHVPPRKNVPKIKPADAPAQSPPVPATAARPPEPLPLH